MTDLTSQIMAYESGDLDMDKTIALFQSLVDSDLAWQLQGAYGRMAVFMLKSGMIHNPPEETP